jgi:hypothetical protein
MPSTLFSDEVVPGVLESITYLNQTFNPTNDELLTYCAQSKLMSKRQCYLKMWSDSLFFWVGGNTPAGMEQPVKWKMYDNEMPYYYDMPMTSEGYTMFATLVPFGPYKGTAGGAAAMRSWGIKNKYWARDSAGVLYLKNMTASQMEEHGTCIHSIQDHTDFYYPYGMSNESSPAYLGQKLWTHTYCEKEGAVTAKTGYLNLFLGDTTVLNQGVINVVANNFEEMDMYVGYAYKKSIKNGVLTRDWKDNPPFFHPLPLGVEELLCDSDGCSQDKFDTRYRSAWYNGMKATVDLYTAYGYSGMMIPTNSTPY